MLQTLLSLLDITPLVIFKIFFLLIEFLYLGFAYVLLKQQKLMAQTLIISVSSIFRLLALVHFLASLFVFLFSFLLILI